MILLSFDTEEFDVPLEHHVDLPFEEQMHVSRYGTEKILDCLKQEKVRATFFCTANFAMHAPGIMQRIREEGHEIASHGYRHGSFRESDLKDSRDKLRELTGCPVRGYRMARMMPVTERAVYEAGYEYNSSLNPTFIPGCYMHLSVPRTYFLQENVLQIPASVTPWFRFPLFWLAYHNLPASLYRWLANRTVKHDGYLATYFHPWEFYPLNERPELKMPFIIRNHSGNRMEKRLTALIRYFREKGREFITYSEFTDRVRPQAVEK